MTSRDDYEAEATALDEEEHLLDPAKAFRFTQRPDDGQPKSTMAVRIAGVDIDRLRALADRTGEGTTQLGRRFILEGLQRAEAAEAAEASPELVAMVAKALDQSRGAIADAVARSLVGRLAETA